MPIIIPVRSNLTSTSFRSYPSGARFRGGNVNKRLLRRFRECNRIADAFHAEKNKRKKKVELKLDDLTEEVSAACGLWFGSRRLFTLSCGFPATVYFHAAALGYVLGKTQLDSQDDHHCSLSVAYHVFLLI